MMGASLYATGHDGTARQVGEDIAADGYAAGAKANAAYMGVGIVADPKAGLPQMSKDIMVKENALSRRDLHRARDLRPFIPACLKGRAAPGTLPDRVFGIPLGFAGNKRSALLVCITVFAARTQPAGIGKSEILEMQVPYRLFFLATYRNKNRKTGQDNIAFFDCLSLRRNNI